MVLDVDAAAMTIQILVQMYDMMASVVCVCVCVVCFLNKEVRKKTMGLEQKLFSDLEQVFATAADALYFIHCVMMFHRCQCWQCNVCLN